MRLSGAESRARGSHLRNLRVISSVKSLKDLWAFQEKVETTGNLSEGLYSCLGSCLRGLGPGQAGSVTEAPVGMILRKEPREILGSGPRARRGGPWAQGQRKGLVGPGPQRAHPQGSSFRPEHCPRTGNGGGSAESSRKTARLSPYTQTGCRLRTRWWCVSQPGAKSWGPRSCKAPLGDPGTGTCAPAATSGTATPDRPRAALRSRAGDSAALDCGARSAQLYARGVGRAGGKGGRAGFWSAGS